MKICFASHNDNKIREIRQLVPDRLEIVSLYDLGQIEAIPETGVTLEENSRLKAQFVVDKYEIPVFADDTGLEIEALDGRPGVYSARYAGESKDSNMNMDKVLDDMEGVLNRKAQFKSIFTYATPTDVVQFEGVVEGEIAMEKSGTSGFGYDPIFYPEGNDRTFSEMTSEEKNSISHRARALTKLIAFLSDV